MILWAEVDVKFLELVERESSFPSLVVQISALAYILYFEARPWEVVIYEAFTTL